MGSCERSQGVDLRLFGGGRIPGGGQRVHDHIELRRQSRFGSGGGPDRQVRDPQRDVGTTGCEQTKYLGRQLCIDHLVVLVVGRIARCRRDHAPEHEIVRALVGNPQEVLAPRRGFLVVDVCNPTGADLLARQPRRVVVREQVLIHVLDIRIVVGTPDFIRPTTNPVDRLRLAGLAAPPPRLNRLSPILARVENASIPFAADLVHFRDDAGPIGDALAQPETV